MIHLITGVPGSGKTLLSLKLVTDQFYDYDPKLSEFKLKKQFQDFTLITNIEDLNLDHLNLNDILKKSNMSFDQFFTVPYQEKVHQKYKRILYIIDEAQFFIPRFFKNKDTVYYFDYHRHFGDDIYLVTQHFKKISFDISCLAEYEYRLHKRSFSVFGEFKYSIKSSGDIVETKSFKNTKHLFELYKSYNEKNLIKNKNHFKKYLLIPVILLIVFGYILIKRLAPEVNASINPNENKKSYTHEKQKRKKISYPDKEKIEYERINLSYIRYNNQFYCVDPTTNNLTLCTNLKKSIVSKSPFGITITALVDPSKIIKSKENDEYEDESYSFTSRKIYK